MSMSTLAARLSLCAPLLSSACVFGSGDPITVERELAAFDAIDNDTVVALRVGVASPGSRQLPGLLTCDDNLVDDIETTVEAGVLRVRALRRRLRPHVDCELEVTTTTLTRLHVDGPSDALVEGPFALEHATIAGPANVTVRGIVGAAVTVDVDGPADVALSGEVDHAEFVLDGPLSLDARGLRAAALTLDGDGPLDARVYAGEDIDVALDGPGDVRVWGQPATRHVDVDGPGDVHFVD